MQFMEVRVHKCLSFYWEIKVCLGTMLLHKKNYLLDSLLCFLCYVFEIISTKDFLLHKDYALILHKSRHKK